MSPGKKFRAALAQESPLAVVGAINAYSALLAQQAGFKALYVSGAGVANASYGLPDLGITNLNDVLIDVARITQATDLPVLVDVDTAWGHVFNIQRTVKEMIRVGAAAIHIEDQVSAKRCGHRPGKAIVSQEEMVDRIKAAVDAKSDPDFIIMARTDALAQLGLKAAIERAERCVEAGADMIFPEAVTSLEAYQAFTSALSVPVLANITEFGKTPLFTVQQLASVGIKMALYPLTAFRAMNFAAEHAYKTLRSEGTQLSLVANMQTREQLYETLDYHHYEQILDEL